MTPILISSYIILYPHPTFLPLSCRFPVAFLPLSFHLLLLLITIIIIIIVIIIRQFHFLLLPPVFLVTCLFLLMFGLTTVGVNRPWPGQPRTFPCPHAGCGELSWTQPVASAVGVYIVLYRPWRTIPGEGSCWGECWWLYLTYSI